MMEMSAAPKLTETEVDPGLDKAISTSGVWMVLAANAAHAQFSQQNRVLSMRGNYGPSAASRILSNSAVSPYLALTDLTGTGGGINITQNYFSIVKPRLDAQRTQMRQQRSINQLQRTVTTMQSAARAPAGRTGARITGHPTRFGNYLQYYPGFGRR